VSPVPFRQSQLCDRLVNHDPGVGHERVEPAECVEDGRNRPFRYSLIGDVAFDPHNVPTGLAIDLIEPTILQIDDAQRQPASRR
jgi:hypothetical protein